MISVAILTDTPARLRDFLIAHNIIQEADNGHGGTMLIGVLPGMEWARVPNRIQTSAGPPPVYDDRAAYLVKFAWESESQKADAFRQWIINNSSVVTAPVGWTLNGEPVGDVRKVNGEQVWFVHEDPDRFGVWQ